MLSGLRVLAVADLNFPEKGPMRLRAMADLGVDAVPLSHTRISRERAGQQVFSLPYRVAHKLGYCLDTEGANRKVAALAAQREFDLVWIEKGNMIHAKALRLLRASHPAIRICWYSDDDMFLPHNQSRAFLECLPHYDCVFTTKSRNRDPAELPALGARRVVAVDKAFDPAQHHPIDVTAAEREALGSDVGFIGSYERERGDAMLFLAEKGIRVRVWGNGWDACRHRHGNLALERRPVVNGADDLRYTKAVCSTRVNLGFLRKVNRDEHTDRSVEIPACGGFLLAERSDDHRRLFAEGREAEFFSSPAELLEKVHFYLANEERRSAVAQAGRRRCVEGDYTHLNRVRFMLSQVFPERS